MDKKELKAKLYEKLKYISYCINSDEEMEDIKYTRLHNKYKEFLKNTDIHYGDCTKQSQTCQRCFLQACEVHAQNLLDYLLSDIIDINNNLNFDNKEDGNNLDNLHLGENYIDFEDNGKIKERDEFENE